MTRHDVEANATIDWLEKRPEVISGHVRPVIVINAAEDEMRELAIPRMKQSQFLAAWGEEMVRIHLHMIEQTELDKRPLRKAILDAAGGMPAETLKLVKEMSRSDDPASVAAEWEISENFPDSIIKGRLGQSLKLLELYDDKDKDYEALDELMRSEVDCDLLTIGPALEATGLVSRWNYHTGFIRISALGKLVARKLGD